MKFTFRDKAITVEQRERDRVVLTAYPDPTGPSVTIVMSDLEADTIAFALQETAKRCRELKISS
jgi:hypothetical protein